MNVTTRLWINSMGEMGREVIDADTNTKLCEQNLGTPYYPNIKALLGGDPTDEQNDILWDLIYRGFLQRDELPLYDQWETVIGVTGVDGTNIFRPAGTAESDQYSFAAYVNHGKVWISWEPCAPADAAAMWGAIEGLVASIPGAVLTEMDQRCGLVSGPDVLDRHSDLSVDVTGYTADQVRALCQRLADSLHHAHALIPSEDT
jgi:hypothetical protein